MTYIEELRDVIRKLHGVESRYVESVQVKEMFQGRTVWEGVVEVFDLIGHPNATRLYAWSHQTDDPKQPRRHVTRPAPIGHLSVTSCPSRRRSSPGVQRQCPSRSLEKSDARNSPRETPKAASCPFGSMHTDLKPKIDSSETARQPAFPWVRGIVVIALGA